MPLGCLALLLLFALAFLLPLFLMDAILAALAKLGLSPGMSLLAVFWIFAGGMINIPVKRIQRDEPMTYSQLSMFGLHRLFPHTVYRRTYTVIAVNLGGCVVPSLIVLYQFVRLASLGPDLFLWTIVAVVINTAVCYRVARPVPGVGIAMPPLVPAIVAAACALLVARQLAPPVAFCAGVLGPLIGADLLHLREINRTSTSLASIGGAGTFDGIVISGFVAALLA
jgi:uncharacterized membrane protein